MEQLARSLVTACPDSTAEDIADVVWLLAAASDPGASIQPPQTPPPGEPQASAPVPAEPGEAAPEEAEPPAPDQPGISLLPRPTGTSGDAPLAATAVSLRSPTAVKRPTVTARTFSLFRRIQRPGPAEVDIDASVEASADARRLVVVTRAGRERGLDVALVVDTSPVMTVHENAMRELEELLLRSGAFRAVHRWSIIPGQQVLVRDQAGIDHHPDQLMDPSGRRLVMVVTDGVSDHWYAAAIWQTLQRWGAAMPTAIVSVLPRRYGARGPLGDSSVAVRPNRPAAPSSDAYVRPAWWDDDVVSADDVAIPVAGLWDVSLVQWAQAITTGTAWANAVWARPPRARSAREANGTLSDLDRVRAFQIRASRGAQLLANVLAGAPVLSFQLIAVLQDRLLPGTGPSELSEVLVSGLLQRGDDRTQAKADWRFYFRPGVGELLRRGTTSQQEWETLEVISDYLNRHAETGKGISALALDPGGLASVSAELEPFARVQLSVAARLGLAQPDSTAAPGTGQSPRPQQAHRTYEQQRRKSGGATPLSQTYRRSSLEEYVARSRSVLADPRLQELIGRAAANIPGAGTPIEKVSNLLYISPAGPNDGQYGSDLFIFDFWNCAVQVLRSVINEVLHLSGVTERGTGLTARLLKFVEDRLGISPDLPMTEPDWYVAVVQGMLECLAAGNAPFNPVPTEYDGVTDDARLVVVGDWGTGLPRAIDVAAHMRQAIDAALAEGRQVHVIHLGSVYFSGFESEIRHQFLDPWPVTSAQAAAGVTSWSLNGNHDMYSGGFGYFGTLLADPRFWAQRSPDGKTTSFFRLRSPSWDFVGLDTSWDTDVTSPGQTAVLQDPQGSYVASVAAESPRKLVLFSHHQFLSFYSPGDIGFTLQAKLAPVLQANRVTAWWWGHEHRAITYGPAGGVAFPRCLGNGGVPVPPDPNPPAGSIPQMTWHSTRAVREDGQTRARFGFAVLDLHPDRIEVAYIDDDGYTAHTETIA